MHDKTSTPNTNPTHKCFASGCRAQVGTDHLMCIRHWPKVPFSIQQEIRQAQKSGSKKAYNDAITAARDHVKG